MKKIYQYFEKLYNEDKISQAFLIGNVVFDDVKSELEETLNSFFFQNNITLEENPDIYLLKTEDGYVSKDKIKELLKNLNSKLKCVVTIRKKTVFQLLFYTASKII